MRTWQKHTARLLEAGAANSAEMVLCYHRGSARDPSEDTFLTTLH